MLLVELLQFGNVSGLFGPVAADKMSSIYVNTLIPKIMPQASYHHPFLPVLLVCLPMGKSPTQAHKRENFIWFSTKSSSYYLVFPYNNSNSAA